MCHASMCATDAVLRVKEKSQVGPNSGLDCRFTPTEHKIRIMAPHRWVRATVSFNEFHLSSVNKA